MEGDRPPSEFEPPSGFTQPPPPTSAVRTRVAAQLDDARRRLAAAQAALARAQAPAEAPEQPRTPSEERQFQTQRNQAQRDAQRGVERVEGEIRDLEKQAAAEDDRLAREAAAARKPTATQRPTLSTPNTKSPYLVRTSPDGTQDYVENPNYNPGGLSDYQAGELGLRGQELDLQAQHMPIYQQQADASSLSAAASMLHAQVARGQLDFGQAKQIFDYIIAQHAPVEEGGKLYNAGFSPSNPVRQFYHLDPEPYSVVDAAGFFGRPELNQYVRGAYPFGAGPMSPDEYRARQAGTAQAAAPPAPVPDSSASGTMMAAQQVGGFAPPAPEPPPPQAPRFGGNQPAGDPNLERIRAMLLQQGVDPGVAEQAAADYVRHLAGGVAAS